MIDFVMLWVPDGPYALKDRETRLPAYLVHMVRQLEAGCSLPKRYTVLTTAPNAADAFRIDGAPIRMAALSKAWAIWASRPKTPERRERYWCFSKIEAVRPDLDLGEWAVLTDLDNFVTAPLDSILQDWFGGVASTWAARENFLKDRAHKAGSHWQSSWVHFRPAFCEDIWRRAVDLGADGLPARFPPFGGWGDQAFWSSVRPHPAHTKIDETSGVAWGDDLGRRYPGMFTSYRWAYVDGHDRDAAVVYAHGGKKPHTMGDPEDVRTWAPRVNAAA